MRYLNEIVEMGEAAHFHPELLLLVPPVLHARPQIIYRYKPVFWLRMVRIQIRIHSTVLYISGIKKKVRSQIEYLPWLRLK